MIEKSVEPSPLGQLQQQARCCSSFVANSCAPALVVGFCREYFTTVSTTSMKCQRIDVTK